MLHAIIMAGGSGTRFWPRSRLSRPKQTLQIVGKGTMIQQTVARVQPDISKASILVITNAAQAKEIRKQLPWLSAKQVLAEPVGRDTSACIGLAAFILRKSDPDAVMAVLSADHIISPAKKFRRCVKEAARIAAQQHLLLTFGVRPSHPSELYGYIRRSKKLSSKGLPAYQIAEFKEKPKRKQAETFIRNGEYYWNSGNFVWRADDIIEAISIHLPELYDGLKKIEPALGTKRQDAILKKEFPKLPKISIDYGIMEKASNTAVVDAGFEWDDVGSWEAIARHQPANKQGNVVIGMHAGLETKDCILVTEGDHIVATVGVDNLIVVHTPDATLICDRRHAAQVKALVELLKSKGLEKYV